MTNQPSIKCISSVLERAMPAVERCDEVMEGIRKAYPYFVPARYHGALCSYNTSGYMPPMLAAAQPYMGNWLLFCDFLQGPPIEEKKIAEVPEIQLKNDEPVVAEVVEVSVTQVSANTGDIAVVEILVEEIITANENKGDDIIEEVIIGAEPEVLIVEEEPEELIGAGEDKQTKEEEALIIPMVSFDYFLLKGEKIPDEMPEEIDSLKTEKETEAEKALMVMMSFSDWLLHFKHSGERQQEETKDQKALKTMWQKEKLAAAMEEENEEIPENVFKMAVDSITQEEGMASETLADIYIRQGKYDHAIDMYRKLSLLNPQKNTYFARKIEEALKNKQS